MSRTSAARLRLEFESILEPLGPRNVVFQTLARRDSRKQFEHFYFSTLLAVVGFSLAVLNVSQIRTPKLSSNPINVALLAIFTVGATIFYGLSLA